MKDYRYLALIMFVLAMIQTVRLRFIPDPVIVHKAVCLQLSPTIESEAISHSAVIGALLLSMKSIGKIECNLPKAVEQYALEITINNEPIIAVETLALDANFSSYK